MEHVSRGTLGSQVAINFIFVESDKAHANHLRKLLGQMSLPTQFRVGVFAAGDDPPLTLALRGQRHRP